MSESFILCALLAGCGSEAPPAAEPAATTTTAAASGAEAGPEAAEPGRSDEADEGASEAEDAEPEEPSVQVVAAERTPLEGEPPELEVVTPKEGQKLWGKGLLRVKLKQWELAPDPGKHVHLIIDNEPYIALRDVSVQNPVDVLALAEEHLGAPLEQGTHVLRLFPSRKHHESVKQGAPFAALTVHYKRETELSFDPEAPLLTYSRPKGCYAPGERILLDFYVTNAELGEDGYRVTYAIDDDTSGEITEWKPHYIENLAEGHHDIQLQLLDENGEFVDGPFNDTVRGIEVSSDCGGEAEADAQAEGDAEPDEGGAK